MHLIFIIFCFFLLFSKGSSELIFKCTGMMSKDSAIIKENDELVCSCSDSVQDRSPTRLSVNYGEIHESQVPYRSSIGVTVEKSYDNRTLTLRRNQTSFSGGGYYGCYIDDPFYMALIYVWVKSKKNFFWTHSHEIKWSIAWHEFIKVPCVPTSPCYDVKLFKGSQEITINETNGVKFDPREGFTITNPSYIYAPVDYTCSITFDGRTENLLYHFTKFDDE